MFAKICWCLFEPSDNGRLMTLSPQSLVGVWLELSSFRQDFCHSTQLLSGLFLLRFYLNIVKGKIYSKTLSMCFFAIYSITVTIYEQVTPKNPSARCNWFQKPKEEGRRRQKVDRITVSGKEVTLIWALRSPRTGLLSLFRFKIKLKTSSIRFLYPTYSGANFPKTARQIH